MSEHLNCDAEGCNHVEQVGTITEEMVGLPCPKCGANLLTAEDWEAWKPLQAIMQIAKAASPACSVDGGATIKVGLHGQKTSIEIERL